MIADRVNKRRLLLATQSTMMVLAFVLDGLTFLHWITVWQIVVLAFLNGTAMAMNTPSYQAMVPRLVPREDLTNAIALNSAQFNMSRILGPTLGGYAMVALGVAGNFLLNALSFLAVLAALLRIRYPEENPVRHESLSASLGAGFRYVRSRPQMEVLIWMIAVASFFTVPFLTFIPYFAKIQLQVGESGLGLLLAASGAGAVLGAVYRCVAGLDAPSRADHHAFCGAGVMAVVVVFCYSLPSFPLSECCMFLEEVRHDPDHLRLRTWPWQHLSSDAMRGRVMSIYATCFLGLPPLGALLSPGNCRAISQPATALAS